MTIVSPMSHSIDHAADRQAKSSNSSISTSPTFPILVAFTLASLAVSICATLLTLDKLIVVALVVVPLSTLSILATILIVRAQYSAQRVLLAPVMAAGLCCVVTGAAGGILGLETKPSFPWITSASPDYNLVLAGGLILGLGLTFAVVVNLHSGRAKAWSGSIGALILTGAGVGGFLLSPDEGNQFGITASNVVLSISEPKLVEVDTGGARYSVLDEYTVTISSDLERTARGKIEFAVGLSSLWGNVDVTHVNYDIRRIAHAINKEIYWVSLPDQRAGAQYSLAVEGKVSGLADGLQASEFDLGVRETFAEDYWSKILNTYDKVDCLRFEFPRSVSESIARVVRLGEYSSEYMLTQDEYSTDQSEDMLSVTIKDPLVDHTYRVFVNLHQLKSSTAWSTGGLDHSSAIDIPDQP